MTLAKSDGSLTNHQRLQEQIDHRGLDAAIALSQPNLTYTSGFHNLDLALLPYERLHATVTDGTGNVTFIHPKREEPVDTWVPDVVVYDDSEESGLNVLAQVLHDKGLGRSRLGIELGQVPAAIIDGLREALPEAQWRSADDLFAEVRLIKTPAEVEVLKELAVATERAIVAAYSMARPGDTEKQVVDLMGYAVTRNGADIVAFNVFASGPRTTTGHHRAEPVRLEPGSIVRVDYGASLRGYYSDLVRMAVVGEPTERQRSIYRRVVEFHREMIDLCRPGKSLRDLWEATSRSHERLGLTMTRSMFGHSIGLYVHEPPIIDAKTVRSLEPGMVLCVEHGWTDTAYPERYHIEDMILVTDNSPQILSNTTSIDDMLVIA